MAKRKESGADLVLSLPWPGDCDATSQVAKANRARNGNSMQNLILLALLLSTPAGANVCQGAGAGSSASLPPFVGIDISKLSDKDRSTVLQATDDFQAVLAGQKPVHAVPDTGAPLPSDGGTTFYTGHGYKLTIEKAFSEIGSASMVAYGPILVFDDKFAPGNENRISDVRFYSHERLDALISCGRPNKP